MINDIEMIAAYIAAFSLLVLLILGAACAIWYALKAAWEFIWPKPTKEEPDEFSDYVEQRFCVLERKIKLLEDFVGATADYIEQKRNSMRDLILNKYGIDPKFHPHYDFSKIGQQPEPIGNNGVIIDGVAYAYRKAKLENKNDTICTTCALKEICDGIYETIVCSIFKGCDEDKCHFERI